VITQTSYIVERTLGSQTRWIGSRTLRPRIGQSACLASGVSIGVSTDVLGNFWHQAGLEPLRVSVNISAIEFKHPDLVGKVGSD